MRRLAIVVSLIVVSLVAFFFVEAGVTIVKVYYGVPDNQAVLLNHAGETISRGELHAFGQTYTFQRIAVGETAAVAFPTRGEGGYSIDVVFHSGRKLSSTELGYLTGGFAMSDLVEIQDDKIVLVERKVISSPEARSAR